MPPLAVALDDDLDWLRARRVVRGSLGEDDAGRSATAARLAVLLGDRYDRLPPAFTAFVADPTFRRRIRSATACYLDLAETVVPAPGGVLVHVLSDQQWTLHWLLFVGDEGTEAVVVTDVPYGFEGEGPAALEPAADASVCAESFNEFLYRFWIENEIWFALADFDDYEPRALTAEEEVYAEQWRRISSSSGS